MKKAATVTLTAEPKLKSPDEYKVIGTDQPQKVAGDIAIGAQKYAMDMELPGMLNAVIARCPHADGLVKSYDDTEALKVPGVRHVVRVNRIPEDINEQKYIADGVAVIADSHWAALKGREALEIEWDKGRWADVDNAWIDRNFDKVIAEGKTNVRLEHGDFDKAFGLICRPAFVHLTITPKGCVHQIIRRIYSL